ncbi:MAG: immunoglobulin domain-containing protein [Phycisphaeraceae bacterium]|nr:immunoglobulin domain-containing protein [Phycisphaeraceae bacterium]
MKRERSTVVGLVAVAGLCAPLAAQVEMRPILKPANDPNNELVLAPVVACFAPGTDPVYVRRVEAIVAQMNQLQFGGAPDYQLTSRWSGAQGTPRALLWSFMPDGVVIPSGAGEPQSASNLFATLDAAFASQGGRATWVSRFTSVFNRWAALTGLSYTRVTVGGNDWDDGAGWGTGGAAGARGDVRIGAHPIDGAGGVLAWNQFPSGGDMCLDSNDSASWASTSNSNRFLRNVVAHEHGHGIGMMHVCPANGSKLMEPFISTAYDGPQQDDIRGAQRHYGDPYESNDTSATATPIGSLTIPGSITFGTTPAPAVNGASILSIDAAGKTDFYSFTVSASCLVSATVTPVGTTYLAGAQTTACDTGTSTNALTMANLSIAVLASNGTTVLASSETQPAGSPEVVSNVGLPGAGTYYVRVTAAGSPTESQLYTLNVAATGNPVCPTIVQNPQGQQVCEGSPVSLTFIATGNPEPTYQWRLNGQDLVGNGANTSTYSLFSALASNAGTYQCVATNACGSVNSAAVQVQVFTGANFTADPQSQTVAAGSPASFTVQVSGNPTPTITWRKNGTPIQGANQTTYTIPSVTPGDAGTYDCYAETLCGDATSQPAVLTVSGQSCYANCDGSTGAPLLTANDFQCFLNKFAAGDTYANCDGSTGSPLLTANDFQCFLNKFAAGCS